MPPSPIYPEPLLPGLTDSFQQGTGVDRVLLTHSIAHRAGSEFYRAVLGSILGPRLTLGQMGPMDLDLVSQLYPPLERQADLGVGLLWSWVLQQSPQVLTLQVQEGVLS